VPEEDGGARLLFVEPRVSDEDGGARLLLAEPTVSDEHGGARLLAENMVSDEDGGLRGGIAILVSAAAMRITAAADGGIVCCRFPLFV
jgi:predicted ABC-class ATPase